MVIEITSAMANTAKRAPKIAANSLLLSSDVSLLGAKVDVEFAVINNCTL